MSRVVDKEMDGKVFVPVDYNLPFIITNRIVFCTIIQLVPGTCRILINILIDIHWPGILVNILSMHLHIIAFAIGLSFVHSIVSSYPC